MNSRDKQKNKAVDTLPKPAKSVDSRGDSKPHLAEQKLKQDWYELEKKVDDRTGQLVQEVADHVRTLKALQESEYTLRGILESIPDGIAVIDLDGNFIEANKALLVLHGYKNKKELMKHKVVDFIAHETRDLIWDSMAELLLKMGHVGAIEFSMLNSQGDEFLVEMSAALLKDAMGKPVGFVSITKDVTRRKRAEQALRESEEKLRAIFDISPVGIMVATAQGVLTDVNQYLVKLGGYENKGEIVGRNAFEFVAIYDVDRGAMQVFSKIMAGEKVGPQEYKLTAKDGRVLDVDIGYSALKDASGKVAGFIGSVIDITDRKHAENALKDSEARNRAVISAIPDMMFVMDKEGVFLDFVPSAVASPMGPPEHFMVAKVADILPPDVAEKMLKSIADALDGGKTQVVEYEIEYPGSMRDYEARIAVYGQDTVLGITRDITDRKHAEHEIQKLTLAIEQSIDGVAITDWARNVTYANKAYAQMHGYEPSEMIGMRLKDLMSEQYLEEHSGHKGVIEKQGAGSIEVEHVKQDGTSFMAFSSVTVIKSADNEPVGLVTVLRDMTEQKRAEAKLKEYSENLERMVDERTGELTEAYEKLVRSEKLAAIGQLASGIAHELRNPLAVINNAAYYLKMKMGGEDKNVDKHLGIMEREVFRSSGIIAGLLDFARTREPRLEQVELSSFVDEIMSKLSMPKSVNLLFDNQAKDIKMAIDAEQIKRVLLNLISNAIQAMPSGGELSIQIRPNDGYVELDVSDTGAGIEQKYRSKIFEPLFTTKHKTGGTGIGLVASKAIVEAHKGDIEVRSREGKGTTISVKLPAETVTKSA